MMGYEELIDFCKKNKKIFCYGAGKYGRVIYQFLLENNIKLESFIVTGREEIKKYRGISIKCIYDVLPIGDEAGIIIGAGEKNSKEIESVLNTCGIFNYFTINKNAFVDIERHTNYDMTLAASDKKVCVLLYHRVCDLSTDVWKLAATPEVFDTHIKYFKDNFNIIRMDDDWSKITEPSLIITFDDGYADNFYHALPILEKYHAPATIFVSTGNMGTRKEFWWDELEKYVFSSNKQKWYFEYANDWLPISTYDEKVIACQRIRLFLKGLLPVEREKYLNNIMNDLCASDEGRSFNRSINEIELKQLASSPYITIGGHTVTHNMLSAEPRDMQQWEVDESKEKIENIINRRLSVFAYPFGEAHDINIHSLECVQNAGYKRAVTTLEGLADHASDQFYIPRNTMPLYQNIEDVRRYLGKIFSVY